ncbi:hypothetical protein PAN31117_02792 [Pandoraea anapnoica]|uniref:Mor transcription activator domain-containing protein n=1 Tax=Pandoraea anapnoica TaxID=2508301 RepID=A0A5E5A5N7_9BURK|nr:Mor transcription activator family protein [Pandoraea anapnoica]VVE67855.1 hypothetical protein PAN31117_02792 [Pandoraea anapnoica]
MDFGDVEHLLPEVAQLLVRVIGISKATRLVEQLGGTTFPVPVYLTTRRDGEASFEALAEIVGRRAATDISKYFGGNNLYVPKCQRAMRELRGRAIRNEFDKLAREYGSRGSVAKLAKQYRIADRHVWRILKMTDDVPHDDQGTLF